MSTAPSSVPATREHATLHPDTTVGPVRLRVTDLELARKFYTRMLGLTARSLDDGTLDLSADGVTTLLRLEESQTAPPRDERTTGLYHFALLLPSRAELGRVVQNVVKTGYALDGLVDHTISEAVYLTDPEGNGIELASDYPRDTWASAMARMANPRVMNKPLDVERLFRAADAEARPWDGIAKATRMGHVHLHVRDVAEALAFYRDVLGFDVMADIGSAAFISAGGYHHHLGLNTWAGPRAPEAGAVGLVHYTVEVPTREERDGIVARLRAAGVALDAHADGPSALDPSGNRLVVTVR